MRPTALLLLLLAAPQEAPVREDYLMVFSGDSVPYTATGTHAFAAVVRVERAPGGAPRVVDFASISWLPQTMKVRAWALRPEKGRNVPLHETLEVYLASGSR